jgi:hypothetical protein
MVRRTILMVIRVALGCLLIVLGIIGLVAPIMPGWILLIPGLVLLSREFISVFRESKIRILRESACWISERLNQGIFRRLSEKLKRRGDNKEQG